MKTYKIILTLFIVLTFMTGCRKDSIVTQKKMISPVPETNIETTINGFIADRNGEPLENATVEILNATTETNEFGFFEITGLVNEEFAVIKVDKQGYFNQVKTLNPTAQGKNQTRIQLTEKGIPSIINSNSGGEITVSTGTTVQFQANSFIDEQGNAYNGEVSIYSFFIDPTDPEVDKFMPGNLAAINAENELRILESFGMVKVKLEGSAGQKLNINKNATINLQVPQSIVNNAPTEIPLWHFDEEKGLWIEEGNAILQNGKYVGEVAHFSFWNCDYPRPLTIIEGKIFVNQGVPFVKVRITNLSTGVSNTSWVNTEGVFKGGVPSDQPLLLEFLGVCGSDVIFSQNIGPFTEEKVNIGTFNISNSPNIKSISGRFIDCNFLPITNGLVLFEMPNNQYHQVETNSMGEFTTLIITCNTSEVIVTGIELDNFTYSTPQSIPLDSPQIILDEIIICNGTYAKSVIYSYGSTTKVIQNCTYEFDPIPSQGGVAYQFQYVSEYPTGSITYYFRLIDTNNDLNNPAWLKSSSFTPSGTYPLLYTGYDIGSANIEVQNIANNPGELTKIKISNVGLTTTNYDDFGNFTNTELHTGATIIFTGEQQ